MAAQRGLSRTDQIALRARAIDAACCFYSPENVLPELHELAERIRFFEIALRDGGDSLVAAFPAPAKPDTGKPKFSVVT